jgi:hypothetical protein
MVAALGAETPSNPTHGTAAARSGFESKCLESEYVVILGIPSLFFGIPTSADGAVASAASKKPLPWKQCKLQTTEDGWQSIPCLYPGTENPARARGTAPCKDLRHRGSL